MSDETTGLLGRYGESLLNVFGTPRAVLARGEGVYVWDVDGNRYLDLLGGIAVNALGHNHPDLVASLSKQAAELVHVSNFFTTRPQIELAETLLEIAGAPDGSRVFFANSGTEAIEAAIKLARRTGRTGIVAAEGAFHGRTTGALALTHNPAYREPFEPLMPGVTHVPFGDADALAAAVGPDTSALFLEPIQGEAGVQPADLAYLRSARDITSAAGALLIVDEIQCGMGRTGEWFAFQAAGIMPDAITAAKGLGGGMPIGALITFGPDASALLGPGNHGSTFGGNPLAAAAGIAVIRGIRDLGLLDAARHAGDHLVAALDALGDSRIAAVHGAGLLRAIELTSPIAPAVADAALAAGFIVNPVRPHRIRLAPPLIITTADLDTFVAALPAILDTAESGAPA